MVGLPPSNPLALDFDTAIMFRGVLEEERQHKQWEVEHPIGEDAGNKSGTDAESLTGEIRF